VTHQGVGGGVSIAEGFKLDKQVLTTGELSGIIAALKGIGTVSEKSGIERTLEELGANSDAVVSLNEPIVIDLASYYKGDLTAKIELIKQAILDKLTIDFDYFYDKGESHRRIEPYFVVFQWTAWYVFGYCLERQDYRLFKLMRLWNLLLCEEHYQPRDIPAEKRDFGRRLTKTETKNTKLVALFNQSVKYQLIEAYGLNCYEEKSEGLYFEADFSNNDFMLNWLLSFGSKVKVLEPLAIAEELKRTAKEIVLMYR
jgi:predicted DNA-binding transcriptional regulator YafY